MRRTSRHLLALAILGTTSVADAAGRKVVTPKGQVVSPGDLTRVKVTVTSGRAKTTRTFSCLAGVPGDASRRRSGVLFTSVAGRIRALRTRAGSAGEVSLLKRFLPKAAAACRKKQAGSPARPPAPGATPAPPSGPRPDHLSLERYTGPFGEAEARILFNRFAFGASPAVVSRAAAAGLAATVSGLMTYTEDGARLAEERDYQCDSYKFGDEEDEPCEPGNTNQVSHQGTRMGVYSHFLYSANSYFEKLFMFLHDERLAVSAGVLEWKENHGLLDHLSLLRRAARSGDYVQYMREWNNDLFGHLVWLDGGSNRGTSPNENYAREFWELGTTGPTDLAGRPVYSNGDIAQAALAFSGWTINSVQEGGFWTNLGGFVPALHAAGPKVVWRGTPWEAVVYDAEDLLQATFRHPRTAEHLAEDLWKEFVNPYATPEVIRELAQHIRASQFNLHPVMERLMTSKAVYAARSRRSLVKHPVDLVFGFLKTTGLPVSLRQIDWMLGELAQQPLNAPSVFGWNVDRLAGEPFVLEWRNWALWLLTRHKNWDKQMETYNFHSAFLSGLQGIGTSPAAVTVDRLAGWFDVSLSEEQKGVLVRYLDYNLSSSQCPAKCEGKPYRLNRDAFDVHPDNAGDSEEKLRGLLVILATLPDYRLK